MAVTAADVKAFAPELDAVADATINLYLGMCGSFVALDRFGAEADRALLLWTAHSVTVAQTPTATGSLSSQQVGDVQQAFAGIVNARGGTGDYGTTRYGLMFDALARRFVSRWIGV
jgi:hypothetical protein